MAGPAGTAAKQRLAETEQKMARLLDRIEDGSDDPDIERRLALKTTKSSPAASPESDASAASHY